MTEVVADRDGVSRGIVQSVTVRRFSSLDLTARSGGVVQDMQKEKLAIVVPYRNRKEHLSKFIPHMEQYLKDFDFKIFIVEQANSDPFNRAILLNIGFKEAEQYDYFCFHDVDMLPLDADYSYCDHPTHLATQVEQFDWKMPYETYFGGVTMFDKASYLRINGFANEYWGWGGEDDDVRARCDILQIPCTSRQCKFYSLVHDRHVNSGLLNENKEYLKDLDKRFVNGQFVEGLTSLKYKKVGEKMLATKTVLVQVTFKNQRDIKVSKLNIMKEKVKFKLVKWTLQMKGK
jgi:hypothetical protein